MDKRGKKFRIANFIVRLEIYHGAKMFKITSFAEATF